MRCASFAARRRRGWAGCAVTRAKSANDLGVAEGPAWKVRIAIGAMVIHAVSRTEPVVRRGAGPGAGVLGVELEPIEGTEHGDTLGFVRWSRVDAVTWRKAAARKHRSGRATVTGSGDEREAAALGVALLEADGRREVFSVSRSRVRATGGDRFEGRQNDVRGARSDAEAESGSDERCVTFPFDRASRRRANRRGTP